MRNNTILLVDDEKNILDAILRLFHNEDFSFLVAQSGQAGLEILQNNKVQLVVSDQIMAGDDRH